MPRVLSILFAATVLSLNYARAANDPILWRSWSDSIFDEAKREGRFVLLDLGTSWCHWCHVMEDVTYHDPSVIGLIGKRYLAVRVDADSRPDLSNRYEDYGWPATVVFSSDGSEIVKRRGYLPPEQMASMLQAIIDDPTPGPSVLPETPLVSSGVETFGPARRSELRKILVDNYDDTNLGWGTVQKFLDWDTIEYCIAQTQRGDQTLERMARETLGAQLNLIDPAWGGVYQYSTDGDWVHPHFEKIMQMQAENLRIYSLAYVLWHDETYLKAANRIREYLRAFLTSPDGALYTSQDADLVDGVHSGAYFKLGDSERREQGIPRIDEHIYARENGWAINALAVFYAVTREKEALVEAIRSARWSCEHRALPNGGFKHDETDESGPYLGDTLSMGRAFLELYTCTGDRSWLQKASEAVEFISRNFSADLGYITSPNIGGIKSRPQLDENIGLARLACLLWHYTGNADYKVVADRAMRFVATPAATEHRGYLVSGVLLAADEMASTPLHITIVGNKDDPDAQELFRAAIRQPRTFNRIEWFDDREGPLPNPDVAYPTLSKAAAFFCTDQACSAPVFAVNDLKAKLSKR
ncbi:MAG TPA: DUF255 domain-containing protein [Chthoniobacterales bacterium]